MIYYLSSENNVNLFDYLISQNNEVIRKMTGVFNARHIFMHDFKQMNFTAFNFFIIDFSAFPEFQNEEFIECVETFSLIHKSRMIFYLDGFRDLSELITALLEHGYYNLIQSENMEDIKKQTAVCMSPDGADIVYGVRFINEITPLLSERYAARLYTRLKNIRINIGVFVPGAGATTAAANLAAYLVNNNASVQIVNKSQNESIPKLYGVYDELTERSAGGFLYNGIEYLPGGEIPGDGVNIVITDFGEINENTIDTFNKGDICLVCSGSKVWELEFINPVMDYLYKPVFLFRSAGENDRIYIEREFVGRSFFYLSYTPEIFDGKTDSRLWACIMEVLL